MKTIVISCFLFLIALISGICFLLFATTISLMFVILLKVGPTVVMCLWMLYRKINANNWLIFVGLLLSMTCDIFMALPGNMFLVYGIISNMLALVLYTMYFYKEEKKINLIRIVPIIIVLGVFYFLLCDYLGNYKLPVLLYCLIYTIFMWRASARLADKGINNYSKYVCFLGCLLLTTSDCLLSFLLFRVIPYQAKYYATVMILWWAGLFIVMFTATIEHKSIHMQAN